MATVSGSASARRLAPVAAPAVPKANGVTAVAPAVAPPPAQQESVHGPDQLPKSKRGWVILVFLLLGAAALAFVGTR